MRANGRWASGTFIYLEHNGCCPSQVSTEVEKVQVLGPQEQTPIHLPSPLLEPGCFPGRHSELPPALSHVKMSLPSWARWHTPIIPVPGRPTQDCCDPDLCSEFQAVDMAPISHMWAWGHVVIVPGASLIHAETRRRHRKSNSRTFVPKPCPPLPTPRSYLSREGGRYRIC